MLSSLCGSSLCSICLGLCFISSSLTLLLSFFGGIGGILLCLFCGSLCLFGGFLGLFLSLFLDLFQSFLGFFRSSRCSSCGSRSRGRLLRRSLFGLALNLLVIC